MIVVFPRLSHATTCGPVSDVPNPPPHPFDNPARAYSFSLPPAGLVCCVAPRRRTAFVVSSSARASHPYHESVRTSPPPLAGVGKV